MEDKKKPWEMDLSSSDDNSIGKKPWEMDLASDEGEKKPTIEPLAGKPLKQEQKSSIPVYATPDIQSISQSDGSTSKSTPLQSGGKSDGFTQGKYDLSKSYDPSKKSDLSVSLGPIGGLIKKVNKQQQQNEFDYNNIEVRKKRSNDEALFYENELKNNKSLSPQQRAEYGAAYENALSNYDKESSNMASLEQKAVSTNKTKNTLAAINNVEAELAARTKDGMDEGVDAFSRGTVRLASSLLKTPSFLYDVIATIPNELINKPLGLDPSSSEGLAKAFGFDPDQEQLSDVLDESVEESQKEVALKYDKGISEYFSQDDYQKGFSLLGNQILESAPTTISLMFGNAAGVSAAQSTLAGGFVFGAEKKSQLEKTNPEMSETDKNINAFSTGLMEGFFEQYGVTKLGGVAKNVLRTEGRAAALAVTEEGFKRAYLPVMKKYFGVAGEEMLSEMATQFAQNAITIHSGENDKVKYMDGVIDAGIVGLGSSVTFSAPIAPLELLDVKNKKALYDKAQEIKNDEEKLNSFREELDKTLDEEGSQKVKDKINEITLQDEKIPPSIESSEKRMSAVELLIEKEKIERSIVGKDKSLTVKDRGRIDEINTELEGIAKGNAKGKEEKIDFVDIDNKQVDSSKQDKRDISEFANEKESYRVIVGEEAFNDIVESGVVRTNAGSKPKTEGIDLANRPTLFPSFSKGKASIEYAAENPNNYIIVTDDPSIQPSTSGRHGKGTTMFPTDSEGKHLEELGGDKVKVYKHLGDGKYQMVYQNGKLVSDSKAQESDTQDGVVSEEQSEIIDRENISNHINTLADENYLFSHVTTEDNARSITEGGMSISPGTGVSSTLTQVGANSANKQIERLINGEVVHRDTNNNSVAVISVPKAELDAMTGKTIEDKFENWLAENNKIDEKGRYAIPKEFNAGYLGREGFVSNKISNKKAPKAEQQSQITQENQEEINRLTLKEELGKITPKEKALLEELVSLESKSNKDGNKGVTIQDELKEIQSSKEYNEALMPVYNKYLENENNKNTGSESNSNDSEVSETAKDKGDGQVPKRGGTPKSKQKVRDVRHISALKHEVHNPYDLAMQYFVGRGKINYSAIKDVFGAKESEKRARVGLLSKDGKGIDALAHHLWEKDNRFDTQEYKEAIENVIRENANETQMAESLNAKYSKEKELNEMSDEDNEYYSALDKEMDEAENAKDYWEDLTDEEKLKIVESFEAEEKLSIKQKADKLAGKILESGKFFDDKATSSIPLLREAWKAAHIIAANIVKAGGTIAEATEKAIESFRNSEYYKGLSEKGKKNIEQDIVDSINGEVAEKPKERESNKDRVKSLSTALSEASSIPKELQDKIKENGLRGDVFSHEEAKQIADSIIEQEKKNWDNEEDAVIKAVEIADKELNGSVKAFVFGKAIDYFSSQIDKATTAKEKERLAELGSNVAVMFEANAENYGRFISAIGEYYKNHPDIIQKRITKGLDNRNAEILSRKKTTTKKIENVQKEFDKLQKEFNKKVEEAVNQEIEDINKALSPDKKRASDKAISALQKFQNKIRANRYSDATGIVAAVDSAITVIVKAIKVGRSISDAIELGVKHINSKMNGEKWNEKAFREDMQKGFQEEGVSLKESDIAKAKKKSAELDEFIKNPNKYLEKLEEKRKILDEKDKSKSDELKAIESEIAEKKKILKEATQSVKEKQEKILNKYFPKKPLESESKRKQLHEKIIEQYNAGVFEGGVNKEGKAFESLFYEKLGILDPNTPEIQNKLKGFIERMSKAEEGSVMWREVNEEMLNYLANQAYIAKYKATGDKLASMWYANILSSPATHLRNMQYNMIQTRILSPLLLAEKALLKGNSKEAAKIFADMFKRINIPFTEKSKEKTAEARRVFWTGKGSRFNVPSAQNILERSGGKFLGFIPHKAFTLPGRGLAAADIQSTQRAYNLKLEEQARAIVKSQFPNATFDEVNAKVNELIGNTSERKEVAREQAQKDIEKFYGEEWDKIPNIDNIRKIREFELMEKSMPKELQDKKEDVTAWAKRTVLTNKPTGQYGAISDFVQGLNRDIWFTKFVVPFVNVPLNVAQKLFDYTPIGWIKAYRGKEGWNSYETELSEDQVKELLIKSINYVAAMVALALLNGDDDDDDLVITGAQTKSYTDNKGITRGGGLEPYSVYIKGHKVLSYRTSPLAAALLPAGLIRDNKLYGKSSSGAEVVGNVAYSYLAYIGDQSAMQGVASIFEGAKDASKTSADKASTSIAKTTSGLIPYSGAVKYVTNTINAATGQTDKRPIDFYENFYRDLPFVSNYMEDRTDHFGDPVKENFDIPMIPIGDRGLIAEISDKSKYYKLTSDHNYFPRYEDDKKLYVGGQEIDLTKKGLNALNKKRGQMVKEALDSKNVFQLKHDKDEPEVKTSESEMTTYEYLNTLDDSDFKEKMNKLFNEAFKKAKLDLFGEKTGISQKEIDNYNKKIKIKMESDAKRTIKSEEEKALDEYKERGKILIEIDNY